MTKGISEPKNDRQGFSVIKIKAVFKVMFALIYKSTNRAPDCN